LIIDPEIFKRHKSGFKPRKDGDPLINGKCFISGDNVVARFTKGLDHKGNHLIGAIADEDLIRVQPVFFSQL
jgi:hypothetical protein